MLTRSSQTCIVLAKRVHGKRKLTTAKHVTDRYTARIDGDWSVLIPPEIREHLRLHTGDEVFVVIENSGSAVLSGQRYPTVASLAGAARTLPQPMEFKEMLETAREDAAKFRMLSDEDDSPHEAHQQRR